MTPERVVTPERVPFSTDYYFFGRFQGLWRIFVAVVGRLGVALGQCVHSSITLVLSQFSVVHLTFLCRFRGYK